MKIFVAGATGVVGRCAVLLDAAYPSVREGFAATVAEIGGARVPRQTNARNNGFSEGPPGNTGHACSVRAV